MVNARSDAGSHGRTRVAERERVRSKVGRRAVMESDPWFASLPLLLRDRIFELARLRWINSGEVLFRSGQAPDHWYGVVFGAIRYRSIQADGREMTVRLVGPGAWFGDLALLDGLPRLHDAVAHGRTALLWVMGADLMALVHHDADFAQALLRLQCLRLRQLFATMEETITLSVEARLARHLSALAHSHGRHTELGLQLQLHLPQDSLGQMLGVSRQRINQALKAWERAGVLQQRYGRITITDPAALDALGAAVAPVARGFAGVAGQAPPDAALPPAPHGLVTGLK